MSETKGRWFEVWAEELSDPPYLLVVKPDVNNSDCIAVYDPLENRIIHQGHSYEDTSRWLEEDEFNLVEGRVFPEINHE